jgi:hypothetical protein
MNKICTSIEQYKKLIELGIDIKTADMGWNVFVDDTKRILPIDDWNLVKDGSGNVKFYPAWSLSALIEFMNRNCYNISLNCSGAEWTVKFDDSETYHHITCDYSIDAAFEMVCWLLKKKKI